MRATLILQSASVVFARVYLNVLKHKSGGNALQMKKNINIDQMERHKCDLNGATSIS